VALQELRRIRLMVRRERREHRAAVLDHAFRQASIAGWKEAFVAAAEHANRRRSRLERPFVGGGINAERQARDNAATRRAEVRRKTARERLAVRRRGSRAYDGNGR